LLQGGQTHKRYFALEEYGVYIKAGAALPFYGDEVDNLSSNSEDIYVTVFPGGESSFTMYEDAGNDKHYAEEYALTEISNTWDSSIQTIRIAPRTGSYKDMPAERSFKVKVVASLAPKSVTVNGEALDPQFYDVKIPRSKSVGNYTVTVTTKGDYAGFEKELKYQIAPKKVTLKLTKGTKSFTAKWAKQSAANQKKFNGYQIRYSLKSNMAGAKYATAAKSSKSKKIGKLLKKKKYYVQVRTFTKYGGKTFYSKWSPKKSVKTK
jgi:alpha-glucosidase (family GH31 glycosyl hydrolase)